MYSVAKILYFEWYKTENGRVTMYPENGDLSTRYEVVSNFTNLEPALKQCELLNLTLSTKAGSKAQQPVKYVSFNTDGQLYDVKAVSSKTTAETGNGFYQMWANNVPFEVAKAFCDFFNFRHPYNPDVQRSISEEAEPIKLVMFPAGDFNNVYYDTIGQIQTLGTEEASLASLAGEEENK